MKVQFFQKQSLKGYTLIEGFPGAGLVGPMAISYIIEKLKMQFVGFIESKEFPPLIAIHGNLPMPPVRIYVDEKRKIVTVLSEFAVPMNSTYELTETVYGLVKDGGIAKIVSIGGMPSQQQNIDSKVVFAITSNDSLRKDAVKAGLKPVGEGVATGVSALMLMSAVMENIPDVNILVPVNPNILDPRYAELAIVSLNKLINLGVDVAELDKEAIEVEKKINDILKRNKEMQDIHKKVVDETGPSMYA